MFSEYRHCLCFLQSIAIACVSLRVSPLLVFLLLVFSEYRHCLCFPQSIAIACVSSVGFLSVLVYPCSARQAQHAHAVFARMSDHGPPNPQFLSTSITKIDGSCGSSSDWRCAVAGRTFCDICQHTSSRPPIAGLSVAPRNEDDMGDGVPTDQLSHNHCDCTDSHCNSHIVTSCVFVLVLHSHHKSIGGRLLLLPRAARDGLALCHLSGQDTSRGVPSEGRHRSKVCAWQKEAGASA